MKSVAIIGFGRVGGALAIGLSAAGYEVRKIYSRSRPQFDGVIEKISSKPRLLETGYSEIDEDVVIISTQDSEIEPVGERLIREIGSNRADIFHTSGSKSSELLKALKSAGHRTGSIHPLASVSEPHSGVDRLRGAYFCVEGSASDTGREIAEALGGRPFSIETRHKPLYHASAVTACGHLVATFDSAVSMLEQCNVDRAFAREILLPLVETTVENMKTQDLPDALTGTFARGDVETFKAHLESMSSDELREELLIYLLLGSRSIELAARAGSATKSDLDKIKAAIDERLGEI